MVAPRFDERKYRFFQRRSTTIHEQLQDVIDGVVTNKDIQDARYEVRIRAWDPTGTLTAFVTNTILTKQVGTTNPGDTGIIKGDVPAADLQSASPMLQWEVVLLDKNVTGVLTPSGYDEKTYLAWRAPVTAMATV